MQQQNGEKFIFQSKQKPRHWSLVVKFIILIVIGSAASFLYFFYQDIYDRYTVSTFNPSENISSLMKDTNMTEIGKFYFFASRPEIKSSEEFNTDCERKEAKSPVLGCYTKKRIYIYDVKNDPRLSGVKIITASHEMLHSAWDRLSSSQKNKLSTLLEDSFQKVKTEELLNRMEYYERQQPGDRAEELHSILGTEFLNIGNELENYYKRYFNNRTELVNVYLKYNKIFVDLESSQKTLLDKINNIEKNLISRIDVYNIEVDNLNSDIATLELKRPNVNLTSWSDVQLFNNQREKLVTRINNLKLTYQNIQKDQQLYDSLLEEYNKNVIIGNGLTSSIDSTLKTPSAVSE